MFIATADPYSGNDIAMTDSEAGSKTQDKSGLVSILDSVSGQTLRTIPGAIWRLGFARDIPLLPIPDVDGTIRLIDVRDESEFQVLRGHKGKVKQAVFSPDGTKLLSGGMDGTVLLWDVRQGTYEVLKDFGEQIRAVAISPKGDLAACAALDVVVLFNLKSRQIVGESGPVNIAYLASLEFSPDGALLVLGELDGRIRTWTMTNQKEGRPFSGHTGPVWSLAFSPDSRRLLSSGTDRKTFLWDVESRRELLVEMATARICSPKTFSLTPRQGSGDSTTTIRIPRHVWHFTLSRWRFCRGKGCPQSGDEFVPAGYRARGQCV